MPLPPGTPDLDVLDLLVSVAETGSLGEAARRHGISQPAASGRMSALERRLRLVLLERGPTGSRLTPAGGAVVDWAVPLLAAARDLAGGVAALRGDGARPRLRVAASLTIADHRMPRWLVALRSREPDVRVELEVGNSEQVASLVRDGADLGFVEGPHPPAGLRGRVVGADDLVPVVAPGHPWARRARPLSLATLARTPLIARERGSGTRDTVLATLRGVADPVPPAAELASVAAIKAAVAAGDGAAVLSRLVVADDLSAHRLVAVRLADPAALRRRFRAVWRPDAPPAGAAAVLLDLARRGAGRAPASGG